MNIQIIESYLDNQLGRKTVLDELLTVTSERGKMLIELGKAKEIDLGKNSHNECENKISKLEAIIKDNEVHIADLEEKIKAKSIEKEEIYTGFIDDSTDVEKSKENTKTSKK